MKKIKLDNEQRELIGILLSWRDSRMAENKRELKKIEEIFIYRFENVLNKEEII